MTAISKKYFLVFFLFIGFLAIPTASASDFTPDANCVLGYHFNESSSPANDFCGSNDGVWNGGVTGISDGVANNADGAWHDERAYSFDGTGYVESGKLTDWTQNFENKWSTSQWVRTTTSADGSTRETIYGVRRESGDQSTWNILEAVGNTGSSGTSPNVWVNDANGNRVKFGVDPSSSYAVNDGNWHHVAVTYDGQGNGRDSYTLYVDGDTVPSSEINIESDTSQSTFNDLDKPVPYGTYVNQNGIAEEFLTGDIDEPKVFAGRELTSTEVSNLNKYNSINEPSTDSTSPTVDLNNPNNGAVGVDDFHNDSFGSLPVANLTATVDDSDNSTVDVRFYDASDDSLIEEKLDVSTGSTVVSYYEGGFKENFSWYVNVSDGVSTVQSETRSFRFVPERNADLGIHVLPDTQNYVDGSQDASLFTDQTEYACNLYDSGIIDVVVHNGDVVSDPSSTTEYDRANESISVLDDCGVPYILAVGNHDMEGVASTRNHDNYDTYFPESRVSDEEWFGGSKSGFLDNYFIDVNGSTGREFRMITTEFCPTNNQISWANSTVEGSGKDTLFNTHNYLFTNDTRVEAGYTSQYHTDQDLDCKF